MYPYIRLAKEYLKFRNAPKLRPGRPTCRITSSGPGTSTPGWS